jgi:hypothetical protein
VLTTALRMICQLRVIVLSAELATGRIPTHGKAGTSTGQDLGQTDATVELGDQSRGTGRSDSR